MKKINLCGLLLTVMLIPDVVSAGCVRQTMANCTINTGINTCSATLKCKSAPTINSWSVARVNSTNATCNPEFEQKYGVTVTFTLTAMANITTGVRACDWKWNSFGYITEGFTTINNGDGLPVELMEFSVDE